MPSFGDFTQFLGGQAFGTTTVPEANLSGKTIIITGGNSGLGLDCSKTLARIGVSRLILGCRDVAKGEEAETAIAHESSDPQNLTIDVWDIDLDSYASVIAFTKRVKSELDLVDAFIVNAGVEPQTFSMSEGIERTLTVNVISTYLSVFGVLPKLQETAIRQKQQTVLTVVGSMAHLLADPSELDVGADKDGDIFKALSDPDQAKMKSRYPLSKLMSMLLFLELAEKTDSEAGESGGRVIMNTVNPGWCDTGLHRYKSPPLMERAAFAVLGRTSEQGSRALVHAVCAGPESHGKYLSECTVKPPSSFVRSESGLQMRKTLWDQITARLRSIWPDLAAETA